MKERQLFRTDAVENVFVVELLGPISSLADSSILYELEGVRGELRDGGHRALVIDLAQATYFGSSLLEAIRILWNDLSTSGGRIALCNASEVGLEVLQVAKFHQIWPIAKTRAEALQLVTA